MIKLENIGKNEVILTLNEKITEYFIPFGNLDTGTYGDVVCFYDYFQIVVRLKSEIHLDFPIVYFHKNNVQIQSDTVIGHSAYSMAYDDGYFYYLLEVASDNLPAEILDGDVKITNGVTPYMKYTPSGNRYNLKLTNCQSLEESVLPIFDVSTNPSRYNKFDIYYNNEIVKEFKVFDNYNFLSNKVYFFDTDIYISDGVLVNIPPDTYIFYNDAKDVLIEGNVNNPDNIIPSEWDWVSTNYFSLNNDSLYLFDYKPGYYDYEITTRYNELVLETGKLLIKDTTNTDVTYNNNENNIIYNG